jgi:hypothetical protein
MTFSAKAPASGVRVHALTPILNVSDVPASIAWFERLGWTRGFTWNAGGLMADAALHNAHGPATFGSVVCGVNEAGRQAPQIFLCCGAQGARDSRSFAQVMADPGFDPHDDNVGATWMSWWVDDCDAAFDVIKRAGVDVVQPPVTEPWGVRECRVRHPDGHYFRISSFAK